ncbi:MAG: hypothetical protein LQ342_002650 [Letrouitia transgressa]|nr:MAG: hypothetical protein LQ342_002650 [Letrouitia transgressa]
MVWPFSSQTPNKTGIQPARLNRPNFNQIHAQPLPLKTYPLPPLILHNPLSVLHVTFAYFWQFVTPTPSHPQPLYRGYFSHETSFVHVTDEESIRELWQHGFFGKGSLSRSEPAWFEREKIRRGLQAGETSEQYTKKRREERKEFKKERARKERAIIDKKLAEEGKPQLDRVAGKKDDRRTDVKDNVSIEETIPAEEECSIQKNSIEGAPKPSDIPMLNGSIISPKNETTGIVDQEHLQLNPEEAFFLVYGLGVLNIEDLASLSPFPTEALFALFRAHSYFPPRPIDQLQPDDPFLLSYVVYHHFRSLGWVVRPGIKFAVDYLLYNRGPVFSHAEFAVIVLPSYSHPYWSSTPKAMEMAKRRERKSWWWLHCTNRVQTQVRKSLVVVFVEVPPSLDDGLKDGKIDIGDILRRFKVREVMLRRWTPNRSRD